MLLDERSTYSSTVLLAASVEIKKIIKIAEFKILTRLKAYVANDTYIRMGLLPTMNLNLCYTVDTNLRRHLFVGGNLFLA